MSFLSDRVLPCCTTLLVAASGASAFDFDPGLTYASVDVSSPLYQFHASIESHQPGGEDVSISFRHHVPGDWLVQYYQVSAGYFFDDDAVITLPDGEPDTLRFDFFTPEGDIAMGWIDIRIARSADPTVWVEETYALGHGVTLPNSRYRYWTDDAFEQAYPQDLVQFFSFALSENSFDDSLLVQFDADVPPDWLAQLVHPRSYICYFDEGEGVIEAVIPFPVSVLDTLRIDIFCLSEEPGIGSIRVKTHSQLNPAIWQALVFRVRLGDIPTAVDPATASNPAFVRAAPNPLRASTSLLVTLSIPSRIRFQIVDVTGRVVTSRETARLGRGLHCIHWNCTDDQGRRLPDGLYFYLVKGGGKIARGKLALQH